MEKKHFLVFGIIGAIIIVIIIAILAMDKPKSGPVAPEKKQAPKEMVVETVTGETINVVNPGKAVDSSEIAPEQLEQIPLNSEAVIKYGVNGLETKTITANAGARVFLSFIAEDDNSHIFSFSDPAMESVLVMFSKQEGGKSINFLAPGVGTYQYNIDGKETGELIIQ